MLYSLSKTLGETAVWEKPQQGRLLSSCSRNRKLIPSYGWGNKLSCRCEGASLVLRKLTSRRPRRGLGADIADGPRMRSDHASVPTTHALRPRKRSTPARNSRFERPLLAVWAQRRKLKPSCSSVVVSLLGGPGESLKFSIQMIQCHDLGSSGRNGAHCSVRDNMKLSSKSVNKIQLIFLYTSNK